MHHSRLKKTRRRSHDPEPRRRLRSFKGAARAVWSRPAPAIAESQAAITALSPTWRLSTPTSSPSRLDRLTALDDALRQSGGTPNHSLKSWPAKTIEGCNQLAQ